MRVLQKGEKTVPNGQNNSGNSAPPKPSPGGLKIIVWILAGAAVFILFQKIFTPTASLATLSYSAFLNEVSKNNVAAVTVLEDGHSIVAEFKKPVMPDTSEDPGTTNEEGASGQQPNGKRPEDKGRLNGLMPKPVPQKKLKVIWLGEIKEDSRAIADLISRGVRVDPKPKPTSDPFWITLLGWMPMLLFVGVWIFFMRKMQGGAGSALSFGKTKAKLASEKDKKTFADVAGVDEAIEEIREVVDFLKNPKKFKKLGGKIPKGILLMGPPGTGKTLLARAVAGEAGVPFFRGSGSDFVEMFVGVGASRVRDLFENGKKAAPCIIFIDELDAVGRQRGAGIGGGHDEREQTLNQILVEMDGFEEGEGVIVLAATNRPDVIDPALVRAGRFDRHIVLNRPDVKGRTDILKVHSRQLPLASGVDLKVVARGTAGFVGADLANLMNEAALLAGRKNKELIEMSDIDDAKDRVLMGTERKSVIMSDFEKKITAYHEAGHTLAASFLPGVDPVHKVTIIPRGRALGVTQLLPEGDKYSRSKESLESEIAVLMAGRLAEEIKFGAKEVTTGAENDIERATELARKMVCKWGMSELGPIAFDEDQGEVFLGREISKRNDHSEETANKIDYQIRTLIHRQKEVSENLLKEKMAVWERIAIALLERETIDGLELKVIIAEGAAGVA